MKLGKTVRSSIDAGYDKAFVTIVDSHVTTLITAFALFLFGTGPIKRSAMPDYQGDIGGDTERVVNSHATAPGGGYCLGLAAFVGAGLAYAGVTDTCGMGMMLAHMPWNQAGSTAESA